MAAPIQGITGGSGLTGDRSVASADVIAEARQRQADRLRAAQAESAKRTEVVEESEANTEADNQTRPEPIPPYRVNLDPGTGRLSTEVLNIETGEVILRIPPAYVDPSDLTGTSTRADAIADAGAATPAGDHDPEVKA
ncbi:hypothetical protein FBZ82_12246 [Azospirillum brasilense]|uniref:Uncharacterized protein n=1 Tax=Azospirillum brasilense TaxID=192 RepID=A0A560AHG7_AZOBR|nr:hypothetical protein [Azospirillum brasilense]TWA59804.1 hypothetical protein FBZ82_12246 [Azospirillum brasilense]